MKELWPLCNTDGLVGALYHPDDGHVAPADVTMALAKGARTRGGEIYRQTKVTGIKQKPNGEWEVKTDKGNITCEHVVTATGSWARQTAAMVGLDIPVIAVEHQYLVTEPAPELEERKKQSLPELAVLRESDASYYMREERQGFILGPYEKGAPAWAVDGVPDSFGQELLPPDIDRLEPHINAAINRVPVLRQGRHQGLHQRPDPLHARRQPADRPGLGPEELLARRGLQLRHHRRRRRRRSAVGLDGPRRTRDRSLGRRPPPLRRLRQQALHQDQERGVLRARLRPALSAGGAAGRAAREDRALL